LPGSYDVTILQPAEISPKRFYIWFNAYSFHH